MHYDVIIAGLGAMGSAAAWHLALRRKRVLGLDRFQPPHTMGSSHGASRIIREAYFEHPAYVPMVQRAYELWQQLEEASNRKLLLPTGGLMIGPRNGVLVAGAKRSAEEHRLPHRTLSASQLRSEFPAFNPSDCDVAVHEPRAGVLYPERGVQTHLEMAARHGAELQYNNPVLSWEPHRHGVRVITSNGQFTAERLLLSVGAWLGALTPGLHLPLTVERQILFWFDPVSDHDLLAPDHCPIFIWEYAAGKFFYGFPDLGEGVKIAIHHQGEPTQPDNVRRDVSAGEIEQARQLLASHLPSAAGPLRSTAVCIYTDTPDEHFLIDYYPACPQVLLMSPCSGHGFKFSTVIGEIAASMLSGEAVNFDLSLFKLARLFRKMP